MNSFDDSLNLWCLNEFEKLKLDTDSKRVSSRVVFLKHYCGQEVLFIDSLDILLWHLHDDIHDLSTSVVQTIKLLNNIKKEFIEKTHTEEWVVGMSEQIGF